jgi:murein DD-endopeptidase MepM/ murein hydrolase activator NlpD
VRSPRRAVLTGTAKAGLALAVATAAVAALGSVIGLPLPGHSDGGGASLSSAAVAPDQGTAAATLTEGPYHPIELQLVNYGEFAARFGGGRGHEGQDMFAKVGTPLVAVRSGEVVDAGRDGGPFSGGRGNYIYIYSAEDGRSYGYLHMKNPPALKVGDKVAAGQVIGNLGCTGSCDGPHLHFEIRIGKAAFGADTKPIDPLPELKKWPPVPGSPRGTGLP